VTIVAQDEQVLVVERKVLEQIGLFHGLTTDVQSYLSVLFDSSVLRFMPRPQAEKDPSYKQLIPYVIISHDGKYLTYVRGKRAGETRLVGNRSIGIGGHINPIDNEIPLFDTNYRELYNNAVEREVAEEITIETGHTDSIVALLNDDTTEVGSVHLGVVHHWILDSSAVTKREQMITQMEFMTPAQLQDVRDSMETWSQFCLDYLTAINQPTS
jgi:predicted NUDIX family phosphoesterase